MKNIHLLPTDKPSRLFVSSRDGKIKLTGHTKDFVGIKQRVYITSDEEIKEGYYLNLDRDILIKCNEHTESVLKIISDISHLKKIVLTTDQDLIEDGVQSIDDEFLEWFVKNPSCEYVDVVNEQYTQNYHKDIWYNRHKIIIPKEGCK
jgi:hypothetical protein